MDIIGQIEKDTKKIGNQYIFLNLLFLSLTLSCSIIGLLARGDYNEIFSFFNLAPIFGIIIAQFISANFLNSFNDKNNTIGRFIYTLSLCLIFIFTLFQRKTPISLQKFEDPQNFIPEALHCLLISLMVSIVILIVSWIFLKKLLPIYSPKEYFKLSFIIGSANLIALALHCQGAIHSHIFLAHWIPAIACSFFLYVLFRSNR